MLGYFANDGSFGDASKILILDTTPWSDSDWDDIANASDSDRQFVALFIASEYNHS